MQCLLCKADVPATHDCPGIHDECYPRLKVIVEENERLRAAGLQLLRCSLPPHDVSGTRMFNEAAEVFRDA